MKAIVVLLVLALAAFARADEQVMGQAVSEVAADEQAVADFAVDMDMDVAEDEDEAVEEVDESDEAEAEAEDESEIEAEDESEEESEDESEAEEEESEFSLIEAEAEAEADEERRKGGKKPLKKRVKVVRAPRALKAKPFKFHPERVRADSTKPTDPELEKLDLALAAVKEDILSTNKQITDERKWVIAVAKIIAAYNDKMKRVEAHIIALRKEMKSLYRKKKQIENLKLQKALESKLKEAKSEHQTLLDSLKHVKVKSNELNLSGVALRNTIKGISAQLAKLRGQTVRKPKAAARGRKCGKGKRFSKKARKCVARKARAGRKANKKANKKKF